MSGTVGILGTGLIGASIGMAGRRRGYDVCGYDALPENARSALERGAIDRIAKRADIYATCEVVVLAMPLTQILLELKDRSASATTPELLMDVGSVKSPVVQAAAGLPNFVGTHPMAGAEHSGPGGARADLFLGSTWAYVPTGSAALDARATSFIEELGAVPLAISSAEHDTCVALTSHLPQALATLFSASISERDDRRACTTLFGPVARELARLGRSNVEMWRDIFRLNGAAVARELRSLAHDAEGLARIIERDDEPAVASLFASAARLDRP